MRAIEALGLLIAVLTFTGPLRAEPECALLGGEFITLNVKAEPLKKNVNTARKLLQAVRQLLSAQLSPRKLRVCPPGPSDASPLARITLTLRVAASEVHAVDITIDDTLTHKRVVRHVELGKATPDSIPLSVAVSIDELLRANWAQMSVPGQPPSAPKPSRSYPRQKPVVALSRADQRQPAMDRAQPAVGVSTRVSALAETDASGSFRLGADGGVQLSLGRARVGMRAAYLRALPRQSESGQVEDHSLLGFLDVGVLLTPRSAQAGLELGGWLSGARTVAVGTARTDAKGASGSFVWFSAAGELLAWIDLTERLHLYSAISGAMPVRRADALDGEQRVALISGPLFLGRLGVGFELK